MTTVDASTFPSGCKTSVGQDFPDNLENVLACQAMFPVTAAPEDIMKFRTPTLRNVALTAPYGHSGAYNTLRAAVEHHINQVKISVNAHAYMVVFHSMTPKK